MSEFKVKDADITDKYLGTIGTGATGDPYHNIPADFFLEVAKGNVNKHSLIHKFGEIDNVTTTLTPVTTSGLYPTPQTPVTLELVSDDNTNDTAGGSGAQEVTIEGISNTNGSWTVETQTVALNGTTAVAVPNDMLRVYRMYVSASGSYADATTPSHNSTITLRVTGGGATWQQIVSFSGFGLGQSGIAVYTVPKGHTGYFLSKKISVEDTKTANVFLFTRENADDITTPFSSMRVKELERNLAIETGLISRTPRLTLPGPCDVGFMANATSGTTDISIDFEILLVED